MRPVLLPRPAVQRCATDILTRRFDVRLEPSQAPIGGSNAAEISRIRAVLGGSVTGARDELHEPNAHATYSGGTVQDFDLLPRPRSRRVGKEDERDDTRVAGRCQPRIACATFVLRAR